MNPLVIRILVLVLFGSVFLFVEHALRFIRSRQNSAGAINFRLKMIAEGRDREQIMLRLRKNGTDNLAFLPESLQPPVRALENLVPSSAGLLIGAAGAVPDRRCGGLDFRGVPAGGRLYRPGHHARRDRTGLAISICAAVVLPLMALSRRAQKLRRRVQEQLPVALDIFVRGLRSGHPDLGGAGACSAKCRIRSAASSALSWTRSVMGRICKRRFRTSLRDGTSKTFTCLWFACQFRMKRAAIWRKSSTISRRRHPGARVDVQ